MPFKADFIYQIVMTQSSIMKTKVKEESLAEDKDQKNESAMNTLNKDEINMDCAFVKDKENTNPSEATEKKKRENKSQRIRNNISILRIVCKITALV